jgi:hypothetical protein
MLEELDYSGLTGIVIVPGDPDYEESRQEFNRAIQKFPLAIVYCLAARDVSNAVRWARAHGASLRIRSGGHNYEGYSVGNAVLVIDVSRLVGITLDRSCRTLTVQTGVKNQQLYAFLANTGYIFPGGSCPAVGISGYALGGGWNFFARYLGLGCDSLVEVQMVDWEGELLTAKEDSNSGLFWACRGGGDGNFGVIVSLTFRLPPKSVRTEMVTYFTLNQPNASAQIQERFLSVWQQWLPCLDWRMSLRPSLYNSREDGRAIFSRGIFFGKPEEARCLLQPLIKAANLKLEMKYTTFINATAILGASYPPSEMFQSTGRFVNTEYDSCEISRIVSLLDCRAEGLELIELGLYALGGRISEVPSNATAYFYRDAQYILGMQAVWTDPRYAGVGRAWVAEAFDTIAPLTVGSFVNFPYDCIPDYEKAYYGGNLPRLRAVKVAYDPQDVFHYPQSIRPYTIQG